MKKAGVPCVPGSGGPLGDVPEENLRIARDIGYPVIIKASGGGGGRGMRVVHSEAALLNAIAVTKARGARPRSATTRSTWRNSWSARATSNSRCWPTTTATSIHLGERDCSMQRRHQKVVEEAPAPGITDEQREKMGERVVEACKARRLPQRRHARVPVPGRRVLLHRDEHAHPGRASGDRADHRHRPREGAAA